MASESLKPKLEEICNKIKESWTQDSDRVEYYIAFNDMLKEILTKESIEEYFSNNEADINYFLQDFIKESLYYILKAFTIYGENGDQIGLEILINIYNLFLKFHKNKKYSNVFELIRNIFYHNVTKHNFFEGSFKDEKTSIKKYDYSKFNSEYNSDFICDENQKKRFEVGDLVDFPMEYDHCRTIDKYCWVRGRVKSVSDEEYIVEYWNNKQKKISFSDLNIYPCGTKTADWDWRASLKDWDLIDCYDRNRWYPSTIMGIHEEEDIGGIKYLVYHVGFRIYPEHFNNLEDPEDIAQNHIEIWKKDADLDTDKHGDKFYGDKEGFDEKIPMFSKRIQKFNTFSKLQLKYLSYNYNTPGNYFNSESEKSNPLKTMNENLYSDTELCIDQFYLYEKGGKKNIIIGKTGNFSSFFALLLKKIEKENGFEKMMEILQDKPDSDEIYTVFFILYHCFNYIHIDFFKEKAPILKKAVLEFINSLDDKEMKKIPKDFRNIVTDLLEKINKAKMESNPSKGNEEEKDENQDFFYEITLTLSLKEIKTSTFNLRLNGIKDLDDFIEKNKNNKKMREKIIELIKKNELIQEIFGANYHSQIINKSKEIVKLLLLENQLNKEDIELIWNCTKRGDLEAKVTILKLLSELADNLKEDYVEMLLNNIKETTDAKKINNEELELVYKLSLQGKENKKNILICCEYLCNCLLSSPTTKINNSPILEKLLILAQKDDIYLKKILEICENCIKKNDKAILSYAILFEIMEKINPETNESISNIIKEEYLLNLFKDNFKLYNKQANEILEKNNILVTDAKARDKFIINGFTHSENVNKRVETFGNLIKYLYKDIDFIPFLKEVLVTNAVSPSDKLIFYQFVKSFLKSDNAAGEEDGEQKEKTRQKLFDLISENEENEVTLEEMNLFISLFLEINKDKISYEEKEVADDNNENNSEKKFSIKIISLEKIEDLKGLDKFWDMTLKVKSEKVLSKTMNILYKIYETNFLPNLLEKCTKLMLSEDSNPQIFDKCIQLLKLIIIESEKNVFFKPKSHLSLPKNSLINFPLDLRNKSTRLDMNEIEKFVLLGNTTINELKIIEAKLFELPPKAFGITFSEDFYDKVNKNENVENKDLFKKKEFDESYNNIPLYQLLQSKLIPDMKPSDKIYFEEREKREYRENLLINNEINPKLELILKQWFEEFTEGEQKMYPKGVAKFVQGVSTSSEEIEEDDSKVTSFLKENDKDNKGYVNEDEFIQFYKDALRNKKFMAVWKNLKNMNIREDLKKKNDPIEIEYCENDKLPRYKLGNDLDFMKSLINQYYKSPETNNNLLEFLMFLTTNEKIYNEVLNIYNNNNEDNFVNKILNGESKGNNYIELNYIFIIIESILQDLEINLLFENSTSDNEISIGNKEYKLIKENYEPFDNEENKEKKINFFKNLIKSDNFNNILKLVNSLLIKVTQIENDNKNTEVLFDCCLRGIKIINIINIVYQLNEVNLTPDGFNENCVKDLNEKYYYDLGFFDLSRLIKDVDCQNELNNISYADIVNNLINYLTKKKEENNVNKNLENNCINLLIDIISAKTDLFNEYYSNEEKKEKIMNLFKNYFCEKDIEKSKYFINYINASKTQSIKNNNNNYIFFLYKITNSLLNSLISTQSQNETEQSQDKSTSIVFTPQVEFFNLYSELNKLIETINIEGKESDNKDDVAKENEGESFAKKVYDLLMKELIEIQNKEENNDKNRVILNLLKLFDISVNNDDAKKSEIVLSKDKTNGESLFNLIYQKYISILSKNLGEKKTEDNQLTSKTDDEENKTDTDNNKDNNETDNDKFILLEDVKEEKQEDNSSTEELHKLYSELVFNTLNYSNDQSLIPKLIILINILKKAAKKEKNGNDSDEDDRDNNTFSIYHHHSSKKQCGHVGLKNLGCICYMNSIMQQIYMVPTFRRAVMWSDDGKAPNPQSNYRYSCDDDNLLHQLQEMYTYLTYSEKMDYNPRGFCFSFKDFDGNPINIAAQQDSQEFLNNFCDKIENSLKPTKFKNIVADVFTGSTCSSVLCDKCKHISNRFEDFYTLTLEVKNINNLNDSLHKLSVPEIIDDFKCSNCNQNVRISKITSLNKLPNVLIIHLKRFYLDYETCHTTKINSRMEFPKKINLKEFCIEEITKNYSISQDSSIDDIYSKEDEYYQYELKGINVHTGSADGGHYFSFIDVFRDGTGNIMNTPQQGKNNWLIFNDSNVSEFDTDKIESECFGGNTEGYSFENCQNAYLLIYERKKKAPIRILLDEEEKKKFEENKENNDKIIKINKENKNKINKEYDLSRIGNTLEEKNLYEKIFYDEDKQDYYKYIPYYNIPKYAPRKYYNEVMKDNNKKPESKIDNKMNKQLLKKYKNILLKKSKEVDFRKDEIKSVSDKQCVLSIILGDFMQEIKSHQIFDEDDRNKINENFIFLYEKLIEPLLDENTDLNILKIINEHIGDDDNCNKIFCNSTGYFEKDTPLLNYENCEKYIKILEKLTFIFDKKKVYLYFREELQKTLRAAFVLIKNSKSKKQKLTSYGEDDKEEREDPEAKEGIIFIFKLLYKLATENENILRALIDNDIIDTLISKINDHIKPIRDIIYDSLLFIIKQTDEYNKKSFDLPEKEKEGEIRINASSIYIRNNIKGNQTFTILQEKPELLKILFIIISKDNESNILEINQFIDQVFKKYEETPEKIYPIIDIMSKLIQINDHFTYDRLITIAGYPSMVVRPIPKEEDDDNISDSSNSDNDFDNNSNGEDRKEKKKKEKKKVKQKWPLFGERLINGDIKKEIYEYIILDHKKNNKCLLSILFPSEYQLQKEEEINDDNNIKFIKLPDDIKKKILLDMIKNIYGERNNYPLFKYLYLMPSRSLLYKNLYSEIISYLNVWEDQQFQIPVEKMKKKEAEYIDFVQKEVKMVIDSAIKRDKKEASDYGSITYYSRDSDDIDYDDDIYEGKSFECRDKSMKYFTGFIGEIIPGEVIREEIFGIAKNAELAMYRIQYYTKYYQIDELRDRLLHPEKYNKDNDEEDKKSEKSEKNKSEKSKSRSSSKSSKKSNKSISSKSSSSSKSKKDEEKNKEDDNSENKEEQLDKENDNENKEEEKNNSDEDKKDNDVENNEKQAKDEEDKKEEKNNDEEQNENNENKDDEPNIEEPKKDVPSKIEEEQNKNEDNKEKSKEEGPKEEENKKEDKKEEDKEDILPKVEEGNKESENKEEEDKSKGEEEKKEEEKKEEEKKEEEKKEEDNKEEDKSKGEEEKEEDNKEEEKKEEVPKVEESKENEQENKSDDDSEKKKEDEKQKSDSEEAKHDSDSNSNKSSSTKERNVSPPSSPKSDNSNKSDKSEDKEKEKEEEKNTEINRELEQRPDAIKYDVSEKNENSIIYKIYRENKGIFIFEDESIKDKNNVKNLLVRYIFSNNERKKKNFHAQIKKQKSLKSQIKKNCFIMDKVRDRVEPNDITCFWVLNRYRENLPILNKDDIVISIGFDSNN